MFGTSQRDWAYLTTYEKNKERLELSHERWSARKELLGNLSETRRERRDQPRAPRSGPLALQR